MRLLIQRVSEASVRVEGQVTGAIGRGFLVFVGFEAADDSADISWGTAKLVSLRLFPDPDGVMNLSLADIGGDLLLVSQFTLHAATKKGARPSYIRAARPEQALPLYETFIKQLTDALGKPVATGVFGADMKVSLVNDGPVTIWIDTKE